MATHVPGTTPHHAPSLVDPHASRRALPRWVNVVVGTWLFVSAFLWPHSAASQTNTWVVGALVAGIAILAMYAPLARLANALLAVWLLLSTIVIEHVSRGTVWHNAFLAFVILGASLARSGRDGQAAGDVHRPPS